QLLLGVLPERPQVALLDHLAKVGVGGLEQAVVTVELAVGEPEAVIGAEVEPAAVVVFRPLAQDRRGGAEIARNAVEELHEVVGAAVEDRLAALKTGVEVAQSPSRRAVEGGGRGLGAERVQA